MMTYNVSIECKIRAFDLESLTKEDLGKIRSIWANDFISSNGFADYYHLSDDRANKLIELATQVEYA